MPARWMLVCLPTFIGDDNAALLLSPADSCKVSHKTLQTEQTTTLHHALKCELRTLAYIPTHTGMYSVAYKCQLNLSVYIPDAW